MLLFVMQERLRVPGWRLGGEVSPARTAAVSRQLLLAAVETERRADSGFGFEFEPAGLADN